MRKFQTNRFQVAIAGTIQKMDVAMFQLPRCAKRETASTRSVDLQWQHRRCSQVDTQRWCRRTYGIHSAPPQVVGDAHEAPTAITTRTSSFPFAIKSSFPFAIKCQGQGPKEAVGALLRILLAVDERPRHRNFLSTEQALR
eukprot:768576-Amphidinium_carterae.1